MGPSVQTAGTRVPRYVVRVVADLARHLLATSGGADAPVGEVEMPAAALRQAQGRVVVLAVEGDCLQPLAQTGEQVVVELAPPVYHDGYPVVVCVGEQFQLGRLVRSDEQWWLTPVNGDGRRPLTEDVAVIAQVLGRVQPAFVPYAPLTE